MKPIRFDVVGTPAPQGDKSGVIAKSKSGEPYVKLIEGKSGDARKRHESWRGNVATAARQAREAAGLARPLDGPLVLLVRFRFAMPSSRPKVDQVRGWCPKVSAPDGDKLLRALGDSLKEGGLIADDARLVLSLVAKVETHGWTGAEVTVRPYTGESGLDAWLDPTPKPPAS